MNLHSPWELKSALKEERLSFIADHLREIYYGVESLLTTDDDCNYGRGTLFFARARQRLLRLGRSNDKRWLSLASPAMDITLNIEGVPFRFFRDDHENPKKRGFWRRNPTDRLFASSSLEPVIFRFIVQRPLTDTDELEIYFLGFNEAQEAVCEWRYGEVRTLHSTDEQLPDAVHQDAAQADLPVAESGESESTGTSNK